MNVGELKDYYSMLGVPQVATVSEIHKAYWQKASRSHPDKGGSHDAMVQLVEAWKILSDPDKRARYDQLLKYRHNGWQNRKFNEDVQDARKRAEGYATSSWAEFEEVYQKAFYAFNQDFYGEDINGKAAGPYSPLMGTKITGVRPENTAKNKPAGGISMSGRNSLSVYIMKTIILSVAIVAALFIYRNFSGIGRYVPLVQQDATSQLMLDTTNGAVYSVEKRNGTFSSPWKETIPPFPHEEKQHLN